MTGITSKSGFRRAPDAVSISPVKILFLLLALAGSVSAATSDPADVAVDFLEKVRIGKVNLEPGKDTALSSYTATEKRSEISRRLNRMAGDLGKGKFEAGDVKIDNDLAAVLVRNIGGFDPTRMRVFAVALVKEKNRWVPAPIPASFENTSVGFADGVRQRIESLENWMLRNQVVDLEQLRDKSAEKMRREITAALDPKILRSAAPREVRDQFLAACARQDLPAILGFLGGLQENLPPDWSDRLRSADAAVSAGKEVDWPWRLLMAPEVVSVPVSDGGEQSEGLFSFACLDPAGQMLKSGTPKVEILHLDFSKNDEGLWSVSLPPRFLLPPGETEDPAEQVFDQQLLDAFPEGVRKTTPEKAAPTLEAAAAQLRESLRAKTLLPLFSLMELDGDGGAASTGCARAGQVWWLLHNPAAPRVAIPLGSREIDETGIVCFQYFSPREPERFDVRSFYFEKSTAGWLLIQGMRPTNSPTESQAAAKSWASEQTRAWRLTWQETLLAESQPIDAIAAGNAPTEEQARQLVESWLSATRAGDIESALRLTTRIKRPEGNPRILQNLGHELGAASRASGAISISHIDRGETWTAVSVKSQAAGSVTFPLYLAIATPAGPRLLIETDLFANSTSGRELLNSETLRRVRDFTDETVSAELLRLFDQFREKNAAE